MSVTAKLTLVLKADETVVAETEDASLWQKVLLAINRGGGENLQSDPFTPLSLSHETPKLDLNLDGNALDKFAGQLGIERDVVEGACAPAITEPYLHLDLHCWEEMKRQTPERGPSAYSAMAIAATLLTLWFRSAGLGNPTQAQAQAVLATINLQDRNAGRGILRSAWLQTRPGGVIVLNPAQASKAVAIAKSFCTKNWTAESKGR